MQIKKQLNKAKKKDDVVKIVKPKKDLETNLTDYYNDLYDDRFKY